MGSGREWPDILFVGPLPPYPTGAAIVCAQIVGGLARLGHRIRAVAPIAPGMSGAADPFAARHPEVRVIPFAVPYVESFTHSAPKDYRTFEGQQIRERLSALIQEARPDVIVIGREIYAWHVPDLARAHALPTVLLSHGGPSTAILNGTWPPAASRYLVEQLRRVDLIVSVASHWAERLRTLDLDNVAVIPNPVDLERFVPGPKDARDLAALDIPPDAVVVLHASSLHPVKRALDLVRAAVEASPHAPQLVYVVLGGASMDRAGPTDSWARQEMEEACRKAGLAERFRFVPWVDHDRMPGYLRLADLVVMPSAHETQSLVYLEAQACGRPLVASDIPGAREVVVDGVTGLLFRTGDVAHLAARILLAAHDPALRARLGQSARAAVQVHDIEDTVAAYATTLARVARRGAHRRRN